MKNLVIVLSTLLLFSFANINDGYAQQKEKIKKMQHRENIIEKLNLTEDQQNKFSDLRSNHQKEMIDLKAELQKKMIDMKELRNNPDLKRADLISAVEEVSAIKNKMAIAKANHKMDMLEILNADQKKIWLENAPFRDNMKMKFKEGRFGHGKGGCCGFGRPDFNNDED